MPSRDKGKQTIVESPLILQLIDVSNMDIEDDASRKLYTPVELADHYIFENQMQFRKVDQHRNMEDR
ncbi:hypothetical protein CEXT_723341 [Caerostris extrusa]|uniref:Uncharacterized protein n=1 Tax=Caerostris extrusa TaxID=172846 RepID=A0AAV4VU33_CAEEX|nr:hypothetical protein CEXT_723341 [Caerostris extrusa]